MEKIPRAEYFLKMADLWAFVLRYVISLEFQDRKSEVIKKIYQLVIKNLGLFNVFKSYQYEKYER